MKRPLSLATLPELDGGVINAAFNRGLRACEADIRDRPGEEKVRKVTLTVEMGPIRNQRGQLDTYAVGVDVSHAQLPKLRSKTFDMLPTPDGALFDELSPDDAHQGSLPINEDDA